MVPEKFRRLLRQEAEKWWAEGLIDVGIYEQLAERYQFQSLERDASHRFIAILMGLGSILLGLAAITFVAANWQVWSRPVKVALLLSLLIGVNAAGFYLWRRPVSLKGQQRLGQGLLLLGALLLGANLALMSQMFHQSGNSYELFLVWGLGVLLMAYSLRLTALGVLAWVLIAMGYWAGMAARFAGQDSFWQLLVQHLPIAASVLFIPLAYWCRSRVIFGLGAVMVTLSLFTNLVSMTNAAPLSMGWLVAIAYVLPPALLWGYSPPVWRSSRLQGTMRRASGVDPFQPMARSLALAWISVLFYGLAFRFWWSQSNASFGQSWNGAVLIDVILLAAVTGLGWMQLRHDFGRGRWLQDRSIHTGTIAVFLILTAGLLIWNFDVGNLDGVGVFFANVLLFLLAIGLIRDGLALGSRNLFWGGMVLLVLGIITRMLEYNTGLLLKSIVFALCGVGVIGAGLWFERNVKPDKLHSLTRSV